MVKDIRDYSFQDDCVDYLKKLTIEDDNKLVITVKAPTGAGKTVMLIKYVDAYIGCSPRKTAFVWLCPGDGDLEEQSKRSMESFSDIDTRDLSESLNRGFEENSVAFINWESVAKDNNKARRPSEKGNLDDRIKKAQKSGIEFILIVDEEHKNDTDKADEIIEKFNPLKIIRVSATTTDKDNAIESIYDKYEKYNYTIKEEDVIEEGLITREICVNEGLDETDQIVDDDKDLLKLAFEKREEIEKAYKAIGYDIRPLIIIQFGNKDKRRTKREDQVLEILKEDFGCTYENGQVAKWMSDEKRNKEEISKNNAKPIFLLIKQAIATGWDCPRAKILVKLRKTGNRDFQIQTLGRIRRMPEGQHYDREILDNCFVYTLDRNYKKFLLGNVEKACKVRKLCLRDEVKGFQLEKEVRDPDYDGFGNREITEKVYDYIKNKYNLGTDYNANRKKLEDNGYSFNSKISIEVVKTSHNIDDTTNFTKNDSVTKKITEDSHSLIGYYMDEITSEIASICGIKKRIVAKCLKRLFYRVKESEYRLLNLDSRDFCGFVINNEKKLKIDIKACVTQAIDERMTDNLNQRVDTFKIPETEIYKCVESDEYAKQLLRLNAYLNYTKEFVVPKKTRSLPECRFEKYCEKRPDKIDWVYKNGDKGDDYLSIVYLDAVLQQRLFYPDYIVQTKDGQTWILETKGGEQKSGQSKNIDDYVHFKFNALKRYAEERGLNWGFVRDKEGEETKLYINNTKYNEEMSDSSWRPLEEVL